MFFNFFPVIANISDIKTLFLILIENTLKFDLVS